jgi:murein L,D-transpeptidase YcbB/YkuD
LALAGIFIFLITACGKKTDKNEIELNEKLNFSYSEYTKAFISNFTSSDSSIIKQDSLIQFYDTLKYFYSSKNFEPVFIKSFEDNEILYSLLIVLEKSVEHGLNPEHYHYSEIVNEFSKAVDTLPNPLRYSNLAKTELLLADAVLKYSYNLRYGLIDPRELFPDSYFLPVDDSSKGDLLQPLTQENIIKYLDDIQPKSKRYKDLQSALKYYNKFSNLEWPVIPLPAKKIEIGSKDTVIPLIAQRLITLEFIDTSKVQLAEPSVYDSSLLEYVKQFQLNNGLIDDGVIGKNTIEKLNTTPQQYIDKIKINLERLRWNEYPDTSQYVLVNIPDFTLFIVDKEDIIFNTKVCTGSKRPSNFQERLKVYKRTKRWRDKPDDWETPNMFGEISYLVLNPTWNVPQSIMREEIVYKMRKDSSYLRTHNFKVYLDTTQLNPDEIKVSDLTVEKVPYRIVQDPGAGNALGKIKFIFNNPFGIYLHDTPNRPPFNQSNRAVSHGCIRVEKPLPLAEFLLRNHPKWNIDFVKIEIGQKVENKSVLSEYARKRESLRKYASLGKTTDVILAKKIPLYIDYYTAWIDENGVINFREDVYDRDKFLLNYLESKKLI